MIRLTIDVSLGILLAACVCCVVFILMENRRMRGCILTGAPTKEAFADSPSKPSLTAAPLKKVDGSELENYDFPDIEIGFEAIVQKIEEMKKTAMKFIEARDLANVVRKDKVTRIDTN